MKIEKPARCRVLGTHVNSPQVDVENIAPSLPKTKHPADFSHEWRGAFRTMPSEEGVRLSLTSNSNLTTWTEETKTPPAKKDDSRGECFRLKRQVSTKGYHRPDYSNEGVGPLTPTIKLNNVSRRNKKPAPAEAGAGIGLFFLFLSCVDEAIGYRSEN